MNIIAADDERLALQVLVSAINEVLPSVKVNAFPLGREALAFASQNSVDIAFLDIDMRDIHGIELAKQLKKVHSQINIIFVTGYHQYAIDGYSIPASGYLLKPVTKEAVEKEITNLRYPIIEQIKPKPVVQCFGGFDVFVRGEPVSFLRAKSKEMLAYLVDRRGAVSTASELAAVLWEDGIYDRSRQKQLSVIRLDLIKSLQQADIAGILVRGYDALAVNPATIECDYYKLLEGDGTATNSFLGEYMSHYSWAEYTAASINMRYGSSSSGNSTVHQAYKKENLNK